MWVAPIEKKKRKLNYALDKLHNAHTNVPKMFSEHVFMNLIPLLEKTLALTNFEIWQNNACFMD